MSEWKKPQLINIGTNCLGAMIAGIIGSVIIVVLTFFLSSIVPVASTLDQARAGTQTNAIFPLILSLITLIGTTLTALLTYIILHLSDGEKYKKNHIVLGQIAFFSIFLYIFLTPIYIYGGIKNYDNIMVIFLLHALLGSFGVHILLELLNNYKYILIGVYGTFAGLLVSIIITAGIFSSFQSGFAKLVSLVVFLPLINLSTIFCKQIFELVYYHYHNYTNQDPLSDIFYQMELEYKEQEMEQEEKNSI